MSPRYTHPHVVKTSTSRTWEIAKATVRRPTTLFRERDNLKPLESQGRRFIPPQRAKSISPKMYDLLIEFFIANTLEKDTMDKNGFVLSNQKRVSFTDRNSDLIKRIVGESGSIYVAISNLEVALQEYEKLYTGSAALLWIRELTNLIHQLKRFNPVQK